MPRTNKTRYVILGLLGVHPLSGYDIRKEVTETTGLFWNESFGQIYPTLRHLATEGLVRKSTERIGGRLRHVYGITPRGRKVLRAWLAEPVVQEPVRRELLLKLFFGRNVAPQVLMGHVREFGERARDLGRAVAGIERRLMSEARESPDLPYWLLTVRFGSRLSRAFEEWSDETQSELERWARGARPVPRPSRGTGPTPRRPSSRTRERS